MPEFIDCEQGTPEWFEARRGIPTASEFAIVLAKGRGNAESKTRRTYLYKLAGEIITGEPAESYSNAHMERGKIMEAEARSLYVFMVDAEPDEVGFIRNGRAGCSPDGLIGESGGLEIKTKLPHLQIETLFRGELPPEHVAQVQGSLWVTEREWWDFVSYWPGMPLFRVRVHRDEEHIAKLAEEVARFNEELDAIVERVRAYGEAA